jgi:pimeloyl-ACP methyl ester carboxylesterase
MKMKYGNSPTGMSEEIRFHQSKINFIRFGRGEKLLIALHGTGRDAEMFRVLEPSLGNRFTIISVDLPFHGMTEWNEKEQMNDTDVRELFTLILKNETKVRFSLLAFSLGGKLALTVISLLAEKIDEVILIAPDGIYTNAWYKFALLPWVGNPLFKRLVHHPESFAFIANALKRFHLIPEKLHKFAFVQMDSVEKRQQVYNVWMAFGKLKPDIFLIKKLINKYNIKTTLIFGEYDAVIPPSIGEKFIAGLKNAELLILPKGHNLVKEELNDFLQ